MDFRRSGSRDERRRRVLMEEAATEPTLVEEATPPPKRRNKADEIAAPVTPYAPGALDQGQPRVAALLPRRRLTLWLWLGASGVVIGLLAYLHVQNAIWREAFPQASFAALDLAAPGSLAAWFSSLTLAWAAFAAVQVYLIRRHRTDDYHGGYRLWLWLAAVLLLASGAAATTLDELTGGIIAALCGSPAHGESVAMMLVGVLAGGCAVRMIWEIKPSRGACTALAFAVVCYLAALAVELSLFRLPPSWTTVARCVAVMLGNSVALVSIGAFGRYVHLEARGELVRKPRKENVESQREKKMKKRPAKTGEATADESRTATKKRAAKTDLDATSAKDAKPAGTEKPAAESSKTVPEKKPSSAAPANKPVVKTSPPASHVENDDFDDDVDQSSNLSKAERRRLRKQKKRAA